ncbi:MAG: hypothetical protein Q8S13_07395 [Dehalococcoidia bacterium]|nr:hypothetical protein [Dehalococcoidia bacterium]
MRRASKTVRLIVQPEDEAPFLTTLAEFCRDNAEDADVCRAARRLRVGESISLGGGAAPYFTITRPRTRKP